jgi:hypothetical protein
MGESFKAGRRRKIAGWQKIPRNLPPPRTDDAPQRSGNAAMPGKVGLSGLVE